MRRLVVAIAMLVASGCAGSPTPTPLPPTMTALERAESDLMDQMGAAGDKSAWLARRGVRVIRAHLSAGACPSTFPVAGVEYGVYYLPSDELLSSGMASFWVELCFATAQDAINAGYQRGPH